MNTNKSKDLNVFEEHATFYNKTLDYYINIMKQLLTLWYKLIDRNFDSKIKSARNTARMIVESTNGRCNHFYDMNGNKIRGYSNSIIRTKTIKDQHPLISQYK